ncbi:SPOR domain-containing protein [Qipengyuania sp. DGS5-3]|uniref:SPOR domain-containing protein n=1 Tax=Qipengyuania sp. DGS5-3 TaxID=3349632 RepID=UPI0036D4084D
MRLLGEAGTTVIALGLSFAVAACAPVERGFNLSKARDAAAPLDASAIAANDERFTIDGITYSTQDIADYDEVGYATLAGEGEGAVGDVAKIAHRTLPIGTTVKITALDSGLRLHARVQARGPMVNSRLIAVSSETMSQLNISEGGAVRVERVAADATRDDMAVRPAVLDILRRSLPAVGSSSLRNEENPRVAQALKRVESAHADDISVTAASRLAHRHPRINNGRASSNTGYAGDNAEQATAIVRTGAFSSKVTAEKVARDLGAEVRAYGRNWRVVSGPLANGGQAEATLAKVRGAGYRDAQIYTVQ